MKLIKCFLAILICTCSIMILISCSDEKNANSKEQKSDNYIETNVKHEEITFDNELDNNKSKDYDEPFILSDILMFKIAKNYMLTSFYEFNKGDVVPFDKAFAYFTYDGCYSFDETQISSLVIDYYNPDKMEFTVPSEIVEEYISNHFNTIIDHSLVDCFDERSNAYIFPRHLGEFYYDMKVVSKRQLEENEYEFVVELTSNINLSSEPFECSFTVGLHKDGYTIHSFHKTSIMVN